MDRTTLSQLVEFQTIAVNQLEKGNDEVAQDFAEDVLGTLREAYDEADTDETE